MPKPDKWNTAHAERERRKRREEKMAGPASAITFSGLGEMIRQTEQFREMQSALGGAMGIPAGAMAATSGIGIGITDGSYAYYAEAPSYTPIECILSPSDRMVVNTIEYRALQAELEATKALLDERDEIIEALSADLGEIDSLREENAWLKGKASKIPDAIPYSDGWIQRPLPSGGPFECPVAADNEIEVILRAYKGVPCGNMAKAAHYIWHDCGQSTIVAYRLVCPF